MREGIIDRVCGGPQLGLRPLFQLGIARDAGVAHGLLSPLLDNRVMGALSVSEKRSKSLCYLSQGCLYEEFMVR